jgi:hypothetical protein
MLAYYPDRKTGIGARVGYRWSEAFVVYERTPQSSSVEEVQSACFVASDSSNPVTQALIHVYQNLPDYWVAFIYGRSFDSVGDHGQSSNDLPRPENFDSKRDVLLAVVEVDPRALP